MDPISQGVLGAAAAQSSKKSAKALFCATLLGALGGMAPDLDVLISSDQDPLLFLEYHRQFTHSLIFIPFGGLAVALLLFLWSKKYLNFKETYLFATLGYATHGLLDACTTYGTLLFWPFSNYRFAWNNVSIIDPFFTIPLLTLCLYALRRKKSFYGKLALAWAVTYLLIGVLQRERAEKYASEELKKQGVVLTDLSAKPSFANLLVWKIVSQTSDEFRVDAVRVGFSKKFFPGDRIRKFNVSRDFPMLPPNSRQARDIERFRWFSNNFLAVSKTDRKLIIDMRYSLVSNEISGLWGIRIDEQNPQNHVSYETLQDLTPETKSRFLRLLIE